MDFDSAIAYIEQYLPIGLILLFALLVVCLIYSALRGFFRGWRYGTYHLVMTVGFALVALFTLRPLVDFIGGIDLSGLGLEPISVVVEDVTIVVPWTNLSEMIREAVSRIYMALGTNLDPSELAAIAENFSYSLIAVVLLFVEGILLVTLWAFLSWLLWHLIVKRIFIRKKKVLTPEKFQERRRYYRKRSLWRLRSDGNYEVEHRKATYRKGRLVSLLEGALCGVVSLCLVVFPLSSMFNALAQGWESASPSEEEAGLLEENGMYQTIDGFLDVYQESLFAQAFFSWNKNESGVTIDTQLVDYFATMGHEGAVSFLSELPAWGNLLSLFIQSGLVPEDGGAFDYLAALSSVFLPDMIRSLGNSGLVTTLLPTALTLVTHFDGVSTYLLTDAGIDFHAFDYKVTLDTAADILSSFQDSGFFDDIDFEGDGAGEALVDQAFSGKYDAAFEETFSSLSGEDLELVNDLLATVAYVMASKEWASPEEDRYGEVGLIDFLPPFDEPDQDGNGIPDAVPEEFFAIDWGHELGIVYNNLIRANALEPGLLLDILFPKAEEGGEGTEEPSSPGEEEAGVDFMDLALDLIADHSAEMVSIIAGADEEEASSSLLGSELLCRGMPKLLEMLEKSMNDMGEGMETDLSLAIETLRPQEGEEGIAPSMKRIQDEMRSLLSIVDSFCQVPEGKAFLKDIESQPGIYVDPEGTLLGVEDGLLDALDSALLTMDSSLIATEVLSSSFSGMLSGEDSPLQALGFRAGIDLGVENLGSELSKIVAAYRDSQGLVTYLMGMGSLSLSTGGQTSAVFRRLASYGDEFRTLLIAIASSPVLNPMMEQDGEVLANQNIAGLLETFLTPLLGDSVKEASAVLRDPSFDIAGEISSIVGVVEELDRQDALMVIMSGTNLGDYANLSFEDLFGALGESRILSLAVTSFLDENVLAGTFLGGRASFANIEDWAREGRAFDRALEGARYLSDLDSIDYFNSDPDAIRLLVGGLSQTSLFDTDGEYGFSRFLAEEMIRCFETMDLGSIPSLFADLDPQLGEDGNPSYTFETFRSSIESMTREEWLEGAETIGDILYCMEQVSSMTFFIEDQNLTFVNIDLVSRALDLIVHSKAFGPAMIPNFFSQFSEAMVAGGFEGFENARIDLLFGDYRDPAHLSFVEKECGIIVDMMRCLVDPVYGFVSDQGSLENRLTKDYFVENPDIAVGLVRYNARPLLSSMEESEVFHSEEDVQAGKMTPYDSFSEALEEALLSFAPSPDDLPEDVGDYVEQVPEDVWDTIEEMFPGIELPDWLRPGEGA